MTQLAIGKPAPLGAHYDGQGVNFTLFSAHAERVELCVFDANGQEHRYDLPGHSGDIWHGYLPDARPGLRYGYRVHGPWQPAEGHRFNPAKLLIDPCARQIDGEFKDNPLLHAGHNEPDYRDNAAIAPKCVVVVDHYDWEDDAPPRTQWGSTIIYEAHVKGLTYLHPEIPVEIRGTYKALGHPVMINYLKQLGITALELLPVAQFASEPRLQRMGLSNYWGYNPVAMFALHPAYACSPETALDEFRDAIKALHKAGIEVILDIVLNHSAELDLDGPLFSLRGIDNRSYYWIREDGDYHNWTGCGNTLNLSHPAVVDYASACLRYWVETCHVDGFRFDLAAVMGRTPEFRQDAPLFTAIQNCPVLSQVKLIAEPWDIAPGGYQVGNFPPLFAEWNDHFRDAARRFWLHYDLPLGAFAGRFAASSDVFKRNGRLPSAAINLVTAHDGFTLRDCVCFNHKHNEANGEENRDGTNNNYSNNHGKEGLGGTLDLVERRRDSIHALLTTLLLSQGTPMLLAGDEHGHSQHGNNNAYCQDNQLTWLDWSQASSGLTAFTAALIHLRKRIPALMENRWWEEGDGNVRWLNRYAQPLSTDEWQNGPKQLQILLSDRFLIAINATLEVTEIVLPAGEWHAIPPFAGEDNPVITAVWQGPAHGLCVPEMIKKELVMVSLEKNDHLMLARQLPLKSVALILAGGRGTRLKDLTNKRAKPAVHFGGKFRIIDFALSNCINSGIRRMGVITQYQSHTLVQHIQRGWSFFNEEMNEFVDLLPAQQRMKGENWYRGTADAVTQNLDIIRRYKAEYVVILAGDHIYKQDYSRMLIDHVEKGARCTVACMPVPIEEASAFGVMAVDENDKIIEFVEKPANPPSMPNDPGKSLASMGIYVFDADYLYELLEEDDRDENSSHDFGKDLIPKITEAGLAYAHPFPLSCVQSDPDAEPYWRDVGTLEAYWKANLDLASVVPELDMYDRNWPIRTYNESLPPAKFVQDRSGSHGMTLNSLVSGGCVISGSVVVQSVLFSRVRVNSFCNIDSAVLLPEVWVGRSCRLRRCVIDRACVIPEGMVIGENAEEDARRFYRSEEGIVLVTREMLRKLGHKQER